METQPKDAPQTPSGQTRFTGKQVENKLSPDWFDWFEVLPTFRTLTRWVELVSD